MSDLYNEAYRVNREELEEDKLKAACHLQKWLGYLEKDKDTIEENIGRMEALIFDIENAPNLNAFYDLTLSLKNMIPGCVDTVHPVRDMINDKVG
jgi:hypothetical protein